MTYLYRISIKPFMSVNKYTKLYLVNPSNALRVIFYKKEYKLSFNDVNKTIVKQSTTKNRNKVVLYISPLRFHLKFILERNEMNA
ncbi:hypothetical protein SRABI96_01567 [Peribacillus sp. Bi96]|nr:hypothetical protein SRABI96_01567 [Peribacillus sp. Bi96]